MRFFMILLLLPASAFADGFALLKGDVPLSPAQLREMTQRPVVEFYEGGQSRYARDGAYSYTYQGGGTAQGKFEIGADAVICITYENGHARCDKFVWSHQRLVMITEKGQRFAIRP